jgi:hypothetical protein
VQVKVDEVTIRASSAFPSCPSCGAIARPNILMFNDWDWHQDRSAGQYDKYLHWLDGAQRRRIVAIELGAGLSIPTVRRECEKRGQVLVRINPREADTPEGATSLPMGALEALQAIDGALQ